MSQTDDVFIKSFGLILGLLVAFAIVISFIANGIGDTALAEQRSSESEVQSRTAPVGTVVVAPAPAEQTAAAPEAAAAEAPAPAAQAAAPAPEAAPAPAAAAPAAAEPVQTAAAAPNAAEQVYQTYCFACHFTGAAGAPKLDDAAAWKERVAQGMDALVKSAVAGKGAMPPKGGANVSEDELRATIEYMLKQAGVAG